MRNRPKKKKSTKNNKASNAAETTGRMVSGVFDGSLITKHATSDLIPFIVFLSGLALFLIFNTYYAEKKALEMDRLSKEIIELRIQYVQTKSTYMYLTNRSELALKLSCQGFIEPREPPVVIVDNTNEPNFWRRLMRINP